MGYLDAPLELELPDSRLGAAQPRRPSPRSCVCRALRDAGVDPPRLSFIGFLPLDRYLAQYNQIDIALDPFPYAGGTTSFDALWMGVPVVSLVGGTAVSRSGLSILSSAGLRELAVRSVDDYHRTVIGLARDTVRLSTLRAELRDRLSTSPAMNARQFAREIETAYNDIVGCQ